MIVGLTFIKCPICQKSKPENKSKDGFNCNYCGFYHKRPDVVACRNILDNYRENKDKQWLYLIIENSGYYYFS